MPSKIFQFLSFQAVHQIAKGIISQAPEAKHFFILLLQATNMSLTVKDCTQLTPMIERLKCHIRKPNDNEPGGDGQILPPQDTKAHLLGS